MQILAKSALNKEELDCKINIGCDGIEIQLLTELIDGKFGRYKKAEDIKEFKDLLNYPVKAVHAPLLNYFGMQDINIEEMSRENLPLLDQIFYIANAYGKKQNIKVLVIVHTETYLDKLLLQQDAWNQLVSAIGGLLFKYPYTEIGIENVTPICSINSDCIHLCSGFYKDNIEIVKKLREMLNTDRVGTVLDTCHAMITKKYMDAIYKELLGKENSDFNLSKFFKINKDYIKLVHLADAKGNGFGHDNHGVEFNSDNIRKLEEIISYYNLYGYDCPITLEIREDNYLICEGYKVTKETLREVLSRE